MPSLTFVMPHWLYWAVLLLFPVGATYLARRQLRHGTTTLPSLFIAYVFWLCSGFIGIHRFYLRSALGFVFIPIFLFVLYCNAQVRDVRDDTSRTHAAVEQAQTAVKRAQPVDASPAPEADARLKAAEADLAKSQREYETAKAVTDHWTATGRWAAALLAVLLLIDAALLPGLVRRQRAQELAHPVAAHAEPVGVPDVAEPTLGEDPTLRVHTPVTDAIEWLNVKTGEFVAWWALIAVFAYYYEVVARYVFNSPTNWVHESMFLMFGMQYLLCGAYAYREDQHVRVDVVYSKFSPRGKAIADIVTSVFFFIFIGTMIVTGYRFAADAVNVGEHSFTEWGIQYWPVKLAIPVGAALMLLQGISKLIKDVVFVVRREA
jgi:TRAP-type mannitol/chloroaromatic compound transport system permease small subunit